jgi:hypothetical protein
VIGHPCARCATLVEGLPVGGVCPACARDTARRSERLARWVALGSAVVLAAYVALRLLPGVRAPFRGTARAVAAVAVVAWWWLTYRIAKEVALVCLR